MPKQTSSAYQVGTWNLSGALSRDITNTKCIQTPPHCGSLWVGLNSWPGHYVTSWHTSSPSSPITRQIFASYIYVLHYNITCYSLCSQSMGREMAPATCVCRPLCSCYIISDLSVRPKYHVCQWRLHHSSLEFGNMWWSRHVSGMCKTKHRTFFLQIICFNNFFYKAISCLYVWHTT